MQSNKQYRVYVLQNEEGRHYIGLSEDVLARLAQHNTGVSKWTRGRGPWNLKWTSEGMPLGEARRLESKLKRQKGGDGLAKILDVSKSDS